MISNNLTQKENLSLSKKLQSGALPINLMDSRLNENPPSINEMWDSVMKVNSGGHEE